MIYHITSKDTWEQEKDHAGFGEAELARFGFIHSSTLKGLLKILDRYEDDPDAYLILMIDERPLKEQIRYEEKDKDHLFPHFDNLIDSGLIQAILPLREYLRSLNR